MNQAASVNANGSDLSLQSSNTSAMRAILNLADMNIKGAVTNGYHAYGQYRNSENLDYASDMNKLNAISLSTVGSSAESSQLNSFKITQTSYGRLNTNYLYQGEAAQVASEFEQRTGMSRESFQKYMAQAAETQISATDPQMLDKVMNRFQDFAAHIPNAQFRASIEKAINLVPNSARTGLLGQAIAKFDGMFADTSGSGTSSDAGISSSSPPSGTSIANAADTANNSVNADGFTANGIFVGASLANSDGTNNANRELASLDKKSGIAIDVQHADKNQTSNIFGDALANAGNEPTIFQQVSSRYRSLESKLLARKID